MTRVARARLEMLTCRKRLKLSKMNLNNWWLKWSTRDKAGEFNSLKMWKISLMVTTTLDLKESISLQLDVWFNKRILSLSTNKGFPLDWTEVSTLRFTALLQEILTLLKHKEVNYLTKWLNKIHESSTLKCCNKILRNAESREEEECSLYGLKDHFSRLSTVSRPSSLEEFKTQLESTSEKILLKLLMTMKFNRISKNWLKTKRLTSLMKTTLPSSRNNWLIFKMKTQERNKLTSDFHHQPCKNLKVLNSRLKTSNTVTSKNK